MAPLSSESPKPVPLEAALRLPSPQHVETLAAPWKVPQFGNTLMYIRPSSRLKKQMHVTHTHKQIIYIYIDTNT